MGKQALYIIDEFSMISKMFLQKFALKIKKARKRVDDEDWWGGLNVIMCGDFHQFPIGRKTHATYEEFQAAPHGQRLTEMNGKDP